MWTYRRWLYKMRKKCCRRNFFRVTHDSYYTRTRTSSCYIVQEMPLIYNEWAKLEYFPSFKQASIKNKLSVELLQRILEDSCCLILKKPTRELFFIWASLVCSFEAQIDSPPLLSARRQGFCKPDNFHLLLKCANTYFLK